MAYCRAGEARVLLRYRIWKFKLLRAIQENKEELMGNCWNLVQLEVCCLFMVHVYFLSFYVIIDALASMVL